MEAVSRGAAKVPVHVHGAAGDGSSTSRKGGYRRCCNVSLGRNGSGSCAAAAAPIDDGSKRGKGVRSYSSVQRHLFSSPLPSTASLSGTRKAVQPESEQQVVDEDNFACPTAHGTDGSVSSSADAQDEDRDEGFSGRASLFRTGAVALLASLEVQGVMVMQALASESNSDGNMQAAAADAAATAISAVSRAPSWLASAIVAFPLGSYFLFGLYRDKINPSAKVTDWLFTLVAVGIVANILLQVTWGVRLY